MLLNNKLIHEELTSIMLKAFPDVKMSNFFVELVQAENKKKHGDYTYIKSKIRVFNLSREKKFIIKTSIHELAHHCDVNIRKKSGHDKEFYLVYKKLLETAIEMGKISWEEIQDSIFAADIEKLKKTVGDIEKTYKKEQDNNLEKYYIKIYNSFFIKDKLKENDYEYSKIENIWYKKINNIKELKNEEFKIKKIIELNKDKNIKYEITKPNENEIEPYYNIYVVGNSFDVKDKLKEKGYYFKDKNWFKKIKAKDVELEKMFLKNLKLEMKFKKK